MKLEALGPGNLAEFVAYCQAHRFDHDESFLSDHDLAALELEKGEDAGSLLRDEEGRLLGLAALMLRPELKAAGKARFRVLHVEPGLSSEAEFEAYRLLVRSLLPLAAGLDWVYLFLPERVERASAIVAELGFSVERYAWLLERPLEALRAPELPPAFSLREARLHGEGGGPGPDAGAWCGVVNAAFAKLAGHTELSPERLASENDPALGFPGSYLFLLEEGRAEPVGLVSTVRDVDDETGKSSYLGPIAVLPERQGRGLGRALLRAGLEAARRAGYASCCLTVNSENAAAAELYLQEGFGKKDVYVCWHRPPEGAPLPEKGA